MSREEDVEYFLTGDHVWPPIVQCNIEHPVMKALREVLLRLPNDIFDEVDERIQFIVQEDSMLAVNVSYRQPIENANFRLDTIVVYKRSFEYPHSALVGLVAHEIAHSFVDDKEYKINEEMTDKRAIEWGFKDELEQCNNFPVRGH